LDGEPGLVAKFYHAGISPDKLAKLEAMCRIRTEGLTGVAAWPLTLLKESRTSSPQALLMRRIVGHASVNQLYGIKTRLKVFPEAQFQFLLHSAINTAKAFATVHAAGQIVGDVNHSNLLISQKATVAMIDCDSFQIHEAGKTFFCPVGVPEFTAPELQGLALDGKLRTVQHDAFGLSVLIFYLLFLGRHPFMGAFDPRAGEMIMLDRAIAEYRFPFALNDSSPEVRLPSFVPRLSDYPTNIGDLFKRAFTRDSLSRGRPSSTEWVSALSALVSATKPCRANSNHQFFSGLSQCPWCRVEGVIGMAVFGIKIAAVADENFNLLGVWARIEAVTATPEHLDVKHVNALRVAYSPTPAVAEVRIKRRRLRLFSVALVLIPSMIAVLALAPVYAVAAIVLCLIGSVNLWKRGSEIARPFYDAYRTAEAAYQSAGENLAKASNVPLSFQQERDRLRAARAEYEALAPAKAKRLADLEASRHRKQLQHHLERFRIEDSRIPMIGEKMTMLLLNNGILDAWDVQRDRILAIDGFGPKKCDSLLSWRAEKEQSFRFNPNLPVDPRDIIALDQEFRRKTNDLRNKLNAGPEVLRQIVAVWEAQRRVFQGSLNGAVEELARATVNRDALRGL
jgi:DNA-binding helix-hairpin-helix protein with protein kinase domain